MANIKRHVVNGKIKYEIIIPESWFSLLRDRKSKTIIIPRNTSGIEPFFDEIYLSGVSLYITDINNTLTINPIKYFHPYKGSHGTADRSFNGCVIDNGLKHLFDYYTANNYAQAEQLYINTYNDHGPVYCLGFY